MVEKVKKLVEYLPDKTECVIHIRKLKQALNCGLVLKKVGKVMKFNQNAWVKHLLTWTITYEYTYVFRSFNTGTK